MECTDDRIKTVRWVFIGHRTVLHPRMRQVLLGVGLGILQFVHARWGERAITNRNRCTLGVRACRMPYSCGRAIGWYVWYD